ncbi:MAG: hypothetical protein AAGE03_13230 [Pseudomonadota bacterium]
MQLQIDYLNAMIERYRFFMTAPAAVFVGVLTMMRFSDWRMSSVLLIVIVIVLVFASWGLVSGGFASGRLKRIKVAVLRSRIAEPLPPLDVRPPSKDALTRRLDRWSANDGGPGDRVFENVIGIHPVAKELENLTVADMEEELDGCETRAIIGMVGAVVSFGLLIFFDVMGLA